MPEFRSSINGLFDRKDSAHFLKRRLQNTLAKISSSGVKKQNQQKIENSYFAKKYQTG